MNTLKKYSFGILSLLIMVSCARQNFERIKINPDKIILARNTMPFTDLTKNVEMTLQMQEKSEPVYYNESNTYFNQNKDTVSLSTAFDLKRDATPKASTNKNTETKTSHLNSENTLNKNTKIKSVSKLNDALKIPLNNKIKGRKLPHSQTKSPTKQEDLKGSKTGDPIEKNQLHKKKITSK